MARTAITPNTMNGTANPPNKVISFTTGDGTNEMEWAFSDGDILLIHNTGAGTVDVDVISVADSQGRTGDDSFTMASGEIRTVGPLRSSGWRQAGGTVHVNITDGTGTDADLNIGVIREG